VIQTEKEKEAKTSLAKQFTVRVEQISTAPEGTPR
jgi:hypothetical protein